MNNIEDDFLTVNRFSRPGEKLRSVKGIVVHYTASPKATAKNIRDYFESLKKQTDDGRSASTHYVVGLKGEIIRMIPDCEVAYHVGSKTYTDIGKSFSENEPRFYSPNNFLLGIEVCHSDDTGRFNEYSIESLVNLIQFLLKEHGLSSEKVYRHFDITGKKCPLYYIDNSAWRTLTNLWAE